MICRNQVVDHIVSKLLALESVITCVWYSRVVVIFEVRNFLAPNPGICEVPGENPLGKIVYESVHIYPVLNDLEVSRNVIL